MKKYNWVDDGYFITEKRDLSRIRRVLIETMLLNFLATAIKLAAGIATGALSVVADALDSLFDGMSNLIGLAGLHAAGLPPDAEHPYGHRKFETVAALSIAFLLFISCWQLIEVAITRLRGGEELAVNGWVLAAMIVGMFIQLGTSVYELRQGRKLRSEILVADALHTRASILVSLSVLVGLLLVRLGYPMADPILAIFVALMIAKIGIDILRETLPVLVDRAPLDPRKIAEIVGGVTGVESYHRVRSRGAEGSAAVDLHVRVSADKTVEEADAIASEVRRRLLALGEINDVTVHMEAQHTLDRQEQDLFTSLRLVAAELGVTIHESAAHRIRQDLYLEVHVGVDPHITLGQAHMLVDRLENELYQRHPEIKEVHTHIEMASRQIDDNVPVSPEFEALVNQVVAAVVAEIPQISQPHNVNVRRDASNLEAFYVSLECRMAGDTPISDAHRLSHIVVEQLSQRLIGVQEVFVHIEPPEAV